MLNIKFSDGLEYIYDSPTSVIVNGIGYCDDKNIVVPDRLPNGKVIVGIAEKAFFRCDGIESINLPSTVSNIGAYAFAWCSDLTTVIAPGAVFIEERAFMGCKNLYTPKFSNMLESIADKAFSYCTALEKFNLPHSLFFMGTGVFEGCKNLTEISLSDKLTDISNSTFNACVNLKKVKVSKNLRFIDEYAFAYCVSLEKMALPRNVVVNATAFYESGLTADRFKIVS